VTANLPDEPEEVWVDAELVGPNEGPRPPWEQDLLDLNEAIERARMQTYVEMMNLQFSAAEKAAFFASALEEHEKQNRLRIIKRYLWVWWSMIILYGFVAGDDFASGDVVGGLVFVGLSLFGVYMLLWNKRKRREILSGRG
jgi:hypothetical protein